MDTLREREVLQQAKWDMLRSDIYIRDKGICWVCNAKVELKDYDLGHLVDRCNGGADDYDNLAVMHKHCNISKPRHTSLEQAMKWKLTPSYLTSRPTPKRIAKEQLTFISTNEPPPANYNTSITAETPMINRQTIINEAISAIKSQYKLAPQVRLIPRLSNDDKIAIEELVIEYFTNRPELLSNGNGYNKARIEASRQLCDTLGITMYEVRRIIREAKLVAQWKPQITDGSQYRYVAEHLDELLTKYKTIKHNFLFRQPKLMGISHFCMDIMFYLAGMTNKVSHRNLKAIQKRVAELQIPIRCALDRSIPLESPTKATEHISEIH